MFTMVFSTKRPNELSKLKTDDNFTVGNQIIYKFEILIFYYCISERSLKNSHQLGIHFQELTFPF